MFNAVSFFHEMKTVLNPLVYAWQQEQQKNRQAQVVTALVSTGMSIAAAVDLAYKNVE